MRIISGRFKGRIIGLPKGPLPTRPTMDYAKEALFNMLQHRFDFEGLRVLDLFAGSGSVGWEFLSRGAEHLSLVEQHRACLAALEQTAQTWQLKPEEYSLNRSEALAWLRRCPQASFDLIFADPPYAFKFMAELPELCLPLLRLNQNLGLFILEHDQAQRFAKHQAFVGEKICGKAVFSFFAANPQVLNF